LRGVTRPASGLTGGVFVLGTDGGDLILKVSPDPASDWKPAKERIVYGLLRARGVPAPGLLRADGSRDRAPFAYTLTARLPGITFSQAYADMDDARRLGVYRQLGDLLGRIHGLTFPGFGDVAELEGAVTVGPARELGVENAGPFPTWRAMHRRIVRARLAFLRGTEFRDLVEPVGYWFRHHDGLLDFPVTPRLLHMDLHMSNVLVDGGRVTGVVDVEEAVIGHNEYDLMRTELAHFGDGDGALRAAFFGGYAAHVAVDAGHEARRPFYELSRALVGLTCLARHGDRAAPDRAGETRRARGRVHELLASSP
jgi:Ser/Thr protein kinase RdoA (MazF antagonist)